MKNPPKSTRSKYLDIPGMAYRKTRTIRVPQIKNKIYLILNRKLPNNYKIIGLGETNLEQFDSKIWYKRLDNVDSTQIHIIDEVN